MGQIVGPVVVGIKALYASNVIIAGMMKVIAVSAVSYAIQKLTAPSIQGALDPGITQTMRNPTAPRRLIYGKRRVGGTLVYAGTTDDDNLLHMMIALAGHEVESISDIYLNDKPLSDFDQGGSLRVVEIMWSDLAATDTSIDITVNSTLYEGSHATILADLTTAGFIVSGSVAGCRQWEPGAATYRAHIHLTVATVGAALVVTSTDGDIVTTTGETYLYRVNTHLGATDQTYDTDAEDEIAEWTTAHRLRGIAYIYVRLRYDRESFPTGIPNVTALVEGKNDIYDSRDTSTGYSVNAALCFADYLSSSRFGFGASYATDFDLTALAAAANICDENVVLDDSSTEDRYTCNGVIGTDQSPKSVLERMLTSMSGACIFSGGEWVIHAGAYRTPTIALDEDDLRGGFTVQTKPSRAKLCNAIKGTYTYRAEDEGVYQPADFPAVENSTYQTEDGEQIWSDIELQFTSSASMAQRLAKIELEKTRQGITLKYPCKLTALGIRAGDVIQISNTRLGWSTKAFEVLEWEFAIDADGALGIDLTLQETAAGVYDWNNGEETTIDIAPNTNLPSPYTIDPVTSLAAAESALTPTDGGQVINVAVSWDAPNNRNVSGYEIEGRAANEENWYRFSTTDTSYQFNGIAAGYGYFVRVRPVNVYGKKSVWTEISFFADGITDTPTAPSDLVITATTDTLTATWTNNTSDEWIRGTNIYAATANNRADGSFGLVTLTGSNATEFSHAADGGTTFYVWITTVDKNGNESDYHPASATAGVEGTTITSEGLTQDQQDDLEDAADLIAGIADDDILSVAEKAQWQGAWNNYVAEATNIKQQAVAYDLADSSHLEESHVDNSTEYNNWYTAGAALGTYMGPFWADMTANSVIVAADFKDIWDDYLLTRQLLLNAIETNITAIVLPTLAVTDLPADVQTELTSLSNQLDDKFVIWAQTTDPSTDWTGTYAEHEGDHWKNTSTNVWQTYSGTAWGTAASGVRDLFGLYDNKTTYHTQTLSAHRPTLSSGVIDGDFIVFVDTLASPDLTQIYERVSGSWTARGYPWMTGADVTASNTAAAITGQGDLATRDTVSAAYIDNATITATQIANTTITATQIANATISATQIANTTITGAKMANATIDTGQLKADAVTATIIDDNCITTTHISSSIISGGYIVAGLITASNINVGTLAAARIAAGSLTVDKLAAGTITAQISMSAGGYIKATGATATTGYAVKTAAGTVNVSSALLGATSTSSSSIVYGGSVGVNNSSSAYTKAGVVGLTPLGSKGSGVIGYSFNGYGGYFYAENGDGVCALGDSGVSAQMHSSTSGGQIQLDTTNAGASKPTHVAAKGTFYLTTACVLYTNTDGSTTWTP